MIVEDLIKKLQELDPSAPVLIENQSEFTEIDTVMEIEHMFPAFKGSRTWMDGDIGDNGRSCFVLR